MYQLIYSNLSKKDALRIKRAGLKENVQRLLKAMSLNPFQNPPPYEKLQGDLLGAYSRRINLQHRLVYQVNKVNRQIRILSMWSHYGN